ncbi:hypothetical protein [uncultured Imperialibacter sp.]|mgnify:CR=1 FL=1|uniref:hypothetical protein n=1 Tax=uncultured Imperialibacter sp. TaxID=1672639 RepID=UPI0030D97A78|tara:strand:- start:255 stop:731 length:477 start_codon:yes stop_codon:yes gene_type:complete
MIIKLTNIALGIILIVVSALTVIPLAVQTIQSDGGGFGFGLLLLPAILPLSFCIMFGLFGFLNYQRNYERIRKIFIAFHVLVAIIGLAAFIIMPVFPFMMISISIAFGLIMTMNQQNIGRQILINNGLIVICLISILLMLIVSNEGLEFSWLIDLWRE